MTRPRSRWSLGILLAAVACTGDSPTAAITRPAHLSPVAASQTGVVGTLLPIPLRVRVSNARGDPLRGVRVAWTPASGTVSPTTSQTDGAGIAETRWTLGPIAGPQQLQASIAGRSSVAPLQLSATAMPGPTTGVVISPQDITLRTTR